MSPNISTRACRALLALLPEQGSLSGLLRYDAIRAELDRALSRRAPKRRPVHRKAKSLAARAATSAVYEEVEKRAGGRCECCGEPFGFWDARPELDHARGRKNAPEKATNTWLLRCDCHRRKHYGPAREWLEKYLAHSERYGHAEEVEWVEDQFAGRIASREAEQQRNLPGVGR